MSFGKRLQEARKNKKFSQEDIAKHLGTKGPAIGRYERDEMKPSIEVAAKIAELLEVSLDFLVGHTDAELDKTTLNRIIEVSKFPKEEREHILYTIDAMIKAAKLKAL